VYGGTKPRFRLAITIAVQCRVTERKTALGSFFCPLPLHSANLTRSVFYPRFISRGISRSPLSHSLSLSLSLSLSRARPRSLAGVLKVAQVNGEGGSEEGFALTYVRIFCFFPFPSSRSSHVYMYMYIDISLYPAFSSAAVFFACLFLLFLILYFAVILWERWRQFEYEVQGNRRGYLLRDCVCKVYLYINKLRRLSKRLRQKLSLIIME
jgi:hypothetical protein